MADIPTMRYKVADIVARNGNKLGKRVHLFVPYKLHPAQEKINASDKRFIVVNSGRRFGKTKFAIKWILDRMSEPNQTVWFVADTAIHAKSLVWAEIVNYIPQAVIKSKSIQDKTITLINDSTLTIRGSDREDSLRGHGIDALVLEEYAFQKSSVWETILRPQLIDRKGRALFISTPSKKRGPHFQDLCELAQKEEAKDPVNSQYAYFHFNIFDNPTLDVKELNDLKELTTESAWKQEYMAEFIEEEGQVYPEFHLQRNAFNSQEKYQDANRYRCVRALDWGMDDPTALLYLHIEPSGKVIITDEYCKAGLTLSKHIQYIRKSDNDHMNVIGSVVDCSIFKRESNGISIGNQLNESFNQQTHRFTPSEGKKTPIDFGINLVKQMLQGDGTNPYLEISSKCKYLIKGLKEYSYGTHEPDTLAALRYGMVYIYRHRLSPLCGRLNPAKFEKIEQKVKQDVIYYIQPQSARKQFEWDYENGGFA